LEDKVESYKEGKDNNLECKAVIISNNCLF